MVTATSRLSVKLVTTSIAIAELCVWGFYCFIDESYFAQ